MSKSPIVRMQHVVERVPAGMEWTILFDLETFGALIDDAELRRVFMLPPDRPLERYGHVVLSPPGRLLAPRDGSPLEDAVTGLPWPAKGLESLADRYRERLRVIEWADADCLGLAQLGGGSGVVLSVVVDQRTGWGCGSAVWDRDGNDKLDSLLSAVGVHHNGAERREDGYVTRLRIHVPTHIQAGRLASFSRTDNCTLFFLREGKLEERLRRGLALAGRDRVREGRDRAFEAVARLTRSAIRDGWATRFEPVHPGPSSAYGDVAPLGLPLRALRQAGDRETYEALLRRLEGEEKGGLWPFHRGGLPTATDTALMALGLGSSPARQALEAFHAEAGAYLPQHCSESAQPGRMRITDSCRHWCQPDYGTTALVSFARRDGGHLEKSLEFLADGFDHRAGLFFANPYFVDWVLAEAVGRSGPAELRRALLAELLAAINDDHTFGRYDVPWSTALGALALAALGYRGRTLRLVQLRLLELLAPDGTMPADSVAFHQSLRLDPGQLGPARLTELLLNDPKGRIVSAEGSWFALAWLADTSGLLATALAALALAVPCESAIADPDPPGPVEGDRLARYRARSPSQYIAGFALPPYAR